MSKINLPNGMPDFLPEVPKSIEEKSPEAHKYLVDLRREMLRSLSNLHDNHLAIINDINSTAT